MKTVGRTCSSPVAAVTCVTADGVDEAESDDDDEEEDDRESERVILLSTCASSSALERAGESETRVGVCLLEEEEEGAAAVVELGRPNDGVTLICRKCMRQNPFSTAGRLQLGC